METILIVEDDATMLRGLKDNFEFKGYRVVTAPGNRAQIDRANGVVDRQHQLRGDHVFAHQPDVIASISARDWATVIQ